MKNYKHRQISIQSGLHATHYKLQDSRYTLHATRNQGFIALISVIILGFVLLATVLMLGNRSIGTRFLLLDLERKDQSRALAEGCVQVAIIEIVNNSVVPASYPKTIPVGSGTCTIKSVVSGTIKTTANVSGATTNLQVSVDTSSGAIISWQECKNSSGVCN